MRDSDVRAEVTSWLRGMHADDANTRIVEEMGIWSNAYLALIGTGPSIPSVIASGPIVA